MDFVFKSEALKGSPVNLADQPYLPGATFLRIDERVEEPKYPRCGSEAFYRYRRTHAGKARALCIVCGRQFTLRPSRKAPLFRPSCPVCNGPMHAYMKDGLTTRFRCSSYPSCRTYLKMIDRKDAAEASVAL
jgi:hypothetical protein